MNRPNDDYPTAYCPTCGARVIPVSSWRPVQYNPTTGEASAMGRRFLCSRHPGYKFRSIWAVVRNLINHAALLADLNAHVDFTEIRYADPSIEPSVIRTEWR